MPDMLPLSTFPTHGGNITLKIGGNITGDMNANVTYPAGSGTYAHQELPYDMTALGSQLKLQNWYLSTDKTANGYFSVMGSFSGLYATDAWMLAQNFTYYTLCRQWREHNGLLSTGLVHMAPVS